MLPVRGVCSLVDQDEDHVLQLIEDGSIAWAFDVALDTKRGRNRELRILPAAVACYLKRQPCELRWAGVIALLLPDAPMTSACEISHTLNVSGDHVYHLIQRKEIAGCSTWRRGPGGSARVPVKSVVKFLQERRFP